MKVGDTVYCKDGSRVIDVNTLSHETNCLGWGERALKIVAFGVEFPTDRRGNFRRPGESMSIPPPNDVLVHEIGTRNSYFVSREHLQYGRKGRYN